jgi:hypothetical protein
MCVTEKQGVRVRTGLNLLRVVAVMSCNERDNKHLGSLKGGEISWLFEQLSASQE